MLQEAAANLHVVICVGASWRWFWCSCHFNPPL
jgi:hypothetical protein